MRSIRILSLSLLTAAAFAPSAFAQDYSATDSSTDTASGKHFAVVGGDPQDLSFDPATDSGTRVGDRTVIREHVTIHRATKAGTHTVVGADGLLRHHRTILLIEG